MFKTGVNTLTHIFKRIWLYYPGEKDRLQWQTKTDVELICLLYQ